MKEPTPIQKKVFDFIETFINQNGFPPTYAEISERFEFQVGMVQQVIRALIRKGKIEKDPFLARGIRLARGGFKMNSVTIPLYGNVAAGEPIFAADNVEAYMSLDLTRRVNTENLFALRIKGESMIGAGILEDDTVIVKKQHDADDGDIVVALIDDEATVKTLRKKRNKAYLEPANRRYKPIKKPFKMLGKVIEVRRRLS